MAARCGADSRQPRLGRSRDIQQGAARVGGRAGTRRPAAGRVIHRARYRATDGAQFGPLRLSDRSRVRPGQRGADQPRALGAARFSRDRRCPGGRVSCATPRLVWTATGARSTSSRCGSTRRRTLTNSGRGRRWRRAPAAAVSSSSNRPTNRIPGARPGPRRRRAPRHRSHRRAVHVGPGDGDCRAAAVVLQRGREGGQLMRDRAPEGRHEERQKVRAWTDTGGRPSSQGW
jgi:hypothetical protein